MPAFRGWLQYRIYSQKSSSAGLTLFQTKVAFFLIQNMHDACSVRHKIQPWSCGVALAGTTLRYRPGLITGGAGLTHDCGKARGIGYFLEPLVCLSLFGKKVSFMPPGRIDIVLFTREIDLQIPTC